MKRKVIGISLIVVLFIVVISSIIVLAKKKEEFRRMSYTGIDFFLFDLKDGLINPLNYTETKALIFVNSTCEHCRNEISELNRHISLFKRNSIYLITSESRQIAKDLDSNFRLSKNDVFRMLYDSTNKFEKIFGNRITPRVLIFNNKGVLVTEFSGEVSSSAIAKILNDNRSDREK